MPDPVDLLERDHRAVEKLFERYQSNQDLAAVEQFCNELGVHAEIEEQVVYPVVSDAVDDGPDLVAEARREHDEVKRAIGEIERRSYVGPGVDELIQELIEGVRHHVEEEENELLPKLRRSLDEAQMDQLGQELDRAKQELLRRSGH
jgi:hemerythrin superfamily protein